MACAALLKAEFFPSAGGAKARSELDIVGVERCPSDGNHRNEEKHPADPSILLAFDLTTTEALITATNAVDGRHRAHHRAVPVLSLESRDEDAVFDALDSAVGERAFQPVAGEELIGAVSRSEDNHQPCTFLLTAHTILSCNTHRKVIRVIPFQTIEHHNHRLHPFVAFERKEYSVDRVDRRCRKNAFGIAHVAARVL